MANDFRTFLRGILWLCAAVAVASVPQLRTAEPKSPEKRAAPKSPRRDNRPSDAASAAGGELRTLQGKHLTLITDVASSREVDDLPKAFDAAFPQWCEYFHIDAPSTPIGMSRPT